MANIKNIMIDCLRDGTEIETVWRLRRSFLNKNISVNDSAATKEHLIMLSHCFVSMTLGKPHSYPPIFMRETTSRSSGLENDIKKAIYEMQDTLYQSKQASAVAAASTHYQHLAIPYNYNCNSAQANLQQTGQFQTGAFSQFVQNQNSSAMYNQNKQDSDLHNQSGYGSTSSFNQSNPASSYNPNQDYSQSQQGAASYGQNQSSSVSGYDYNNQRSSSGYQQQDSRTRHDQTASYDQNHQTSSYDHIKQNSASSYDHNRRSSSYEGRRRQDSTSSHDQDRKNSSYDDYRQDSTSSHDQDCKISSYDGYRRQDSTLSYDQSCQRSSYDDRKQASTSLYNRSHQGTSYDHRQQDSASYNQNQHDTVSSVNPSLQESGSFGQSRDMLSHTPKTQYVNQAPTLTHYGGKKRMVDTNALSIIPIRKGRANKGLPSKKALKKLRRNIARESMSKFEGTSNFIKGQTQKNTLTDAAASLASFQPSETFPVQPLFENIRKSSVTAPAPSSPSGSITMKTAATVARVAKRETPDSGGKQRGSDTAPEKAKTNSVTVIKEDSGCSSVIMEKLVPIFNMANLYLKMDKSVDPFTALQKCAAGANQKIKCISKSGVNSDGVKEVTCSVNANDICLVSVVVKGGTNPQDAKKQLANAVLEKITLPHLRVVSAADADLKLEGSITSIYGSVINPGQNDGKETSRNADHTPVNKKATAPRSTIPQKANTNAIHQGKKKIQIPRDPKWFLRKKLPRPTEEAPTKYSNFDSYIAWRWEKHPLLKKVRKLGHMFVTLPFKRRSWKLENDAAILQLLVNVGGIQLEIKETQGAVSANEYSVLMDGKICLLSCSVSPSKDPAQFISKEVLTKVSMPYLCLVNDSLLASSTPFKDREVFSLSKYAILDTGQTDESRLKTYTKPVRVEDYCLYDSHNTKVQNNFEYSGELSRKQLTLKTGLTPDQKERLGYYTVSGKVLGGGCLNFKKTKTKALRNCAADACIRNLKKCHWTIQKQRLSEDKFVYPDDLLSNIQTESDALEGNNKGFQLLSKMGWRGGGIGRDGTGIEEPIRSTNLLSKNSGLGFKKVPTKSNIKTMTDCSKINHSQLLEAYTDSTFHRDLYIMCQHANVRGQIFKMAEELDLVASTRGIRQNKRVLVTKMFDARMIVTDCMDLGGKSDLFKLVPPQEVDFEPPMHLFRENDHTKMCVQQSKRTRKAERVRASRIAAVLKSTLAGVDYQEGSSGVSSTHFNTVQNSINSASSSSIARLSEVTNKLIKSKSIQCNLLDAPRLEKFGPAQELCDIVYEYDDEGEVDDESEREDSDHGSGSEYEDYDDDDDIDEDDVDEETSDLTNREAGGNSLDRKRKSCVTGDADSDIYGAFEIKKMR